MNAKVIIIIRFRSKIFIRAFVLVYLHGCKICRQECTFRR